MKKIVYVLVLIMSLSFALITHAEQDIKVIVNDKEISFDVSPQIIDGRTMVPLRAIFESLGAIVEWDATTGTITGTKGNTTLVLYLNKREAKLNSNDIWLDSAPVSINGRALVPTRVVSESLGMHVSWNGTNRKVSISDLNKEFLSVVKSSDNEKLVNLVNDYKNLDYNTVDENGNTALHIAILNCNSDIVDALLKTTCNVFLENKNGQAPLEFVKICKSKDYTQEYKYNSIDRAIKHKIEESTTYKLVQEFSKLATPMGDYYFDVIVSFYGDELSIALNSTNILDAAYDIESESSRYSDNAKQATLTLLQDHMSKMMINISKTMKDVLVKGKYMYFQYRYEYIKEDPFGASGFECECINGKITFETTTLSSF